MVLCNGNPNKLMYFLFPPAHHPKSLMIWLGPCPHLLGSPSLSRPLLMLSMPKAPFLTLCMALWHNFQSHLQSHHLREAFPDPLCKVRTAPTPVLSHSTMSFSFPAFLISVFTHTGVPQYSSLICSGTLMSADTNAYRAGDD